MGDILVLDAVTESSRWKSELKPKLKVVDLLVVKHLGNEEVFRHVSAKPAQTIQPVQFNLLDEIRHSSETTNARNVECKMIPRCTGAKVHLQQQGSKLAHLEYVKQHQEPTHEAFSTFMAEDEQLTCSSSSSSSSSLVQMQNQHSYCGKFGRLNTWQCV
jgi:hypothetical protein